MTALNNLSDLYDAMQLVSRMHTVQIAIHDREVNLVKKCLLNFGTWLSASQLVAHTVASLHICSFELTSTSKYHPDL